MYQKNIINLYIALTVIAILLFSCLTVYARGATETANISARAAVLYQPDSQCFVYSKQAEMRLPMASTTKLMTAMVALEHITDMNQYVTITDEAQGIEGSSAYLRAGEKVRVEELIYALLLRSANDAAVALACYTAGSVEEFSQLMNRKAKELGLADTNFTNPHGLDDAEHYTTAKDLALIASAALEDPTIRKVSSTYKKSFDHGEITRTYVNHNKLLKNYDGCIGLKTGYTKKSGRCLVSAAEKDGLMFIAVTLDAPNDWSDHKKLLDLGYDSMKRIEVITPAEYSKSIAVLNGKQAETTVENTEALSVVIPQDGGQIEFYPELPRFICAPIKKGQKIGRIRFVIDGELTLECGIFATENVEAVGGGGIFDKIFKSR